MNAATTVVVIAAAQAAAERNAWIKVLGDAKAVTASSALPRIGLPKISDANLKVLLDTGVVRREGAERFYLDRQRQRIQLENQARANKAGVFVLLGFATVLAGMLVYFVSR